MNKICWNIQVIKVDGSYLSIFEQGFESKYLRILTFLLRAKSSNRHGSIGRQDHLRAGAALRFRPHLYLLTLILIEQTD